MDGDPAFSGGDMSQRRDAASLSIAYCCVSPAHWADAPVTSGAPTAHEGRPAYCPGSAKVTTPHDWIITGGVPLRILERIPGGSQGAPAHRSFRQNGADRTRAARHKPERR